MELLLLLVGLLVGAAAGLAVGVARGRADTGAALREVARLQAAVDVERASARTVEATLSAERAAAADREALLARTDDRLRETFGTLSAEALQRSTEALLQLAEQKLATTTKAADGDLAQRQKAIEGLVTPLQASLERVQEQLRSVERGRAVSEAALHEQLAGMRSTSEQLRSETSQLVTALRAPQVRGRWGELQLERAVEAAGMSEHIDYVTQATATGEDGTVRPDLVVKLVGGKNVVVDSKVSFNGYLEAMEARDEATKAARLKAHARHLRDHIDALAAKSYWERFTPSPEFVVCFVPADAFLDAALREEPTLLEHAFNRNVVVATPSTLIALLRTVAYTWRQEALAANAAEVHKLGKELYQRICTVGAHLDRLGKSIGDTVGHYNKAITSLESRVFVTARKMTDLQVVDPAEVLESPRQLTETVRLAQAPELADQRVVPLAKSGSRAAVPAGQDALPDWDRPDATRSGA